MITPGTWQKSSFSGGGEGNACVEVVHRDTHIAIRDSKAPTRATLTIPTGAFTTFVEALKTPVSGWAGKTEA
ncbi:hypothetical protein SSP24_35190 [Streptomyces spinoverrucosus]|uniref:DUF397 domain-containing protein n=1 Tax=Streptomyces spinoverrucosus TaxID=284043 RepID=A0A4Y3VG33_9ACTN|nr:DUF397 domain-containing protein [Streptomyces spinoverrucosus]GEC05864.1 hypothetical protein SSP24_35190 [Streptomyces spinoverrucosus]GHB82177.1 hypothetical protein GCM10010397_61500 [Streptomyces spinoverrucosus]